MHMKQPNQRDNVKYFQQIYASFVISTSILITAFWTMYISPILLKFERKEMNFNITSTEKAWIVSIMDFGNLLSAIPAGLAMDKCGRKYTLLLSAAIYTAASIFTILATSGKYLFAARLLAGIAKGLSFTVAPIYVSEISSKTIRGALSSTFYGFFCAGTIIAASVGPYVSYQMFNFIGLALSLVFMTLMIPIPESMYYYIMRKKPDKAEKAMRWFRHITNEQQMAQTQEELADIHTELQSRTADKAKYHELLTQSMYRRAFLIVALTTLTQRCGGISYMLSYGAADLPGSGRPFSRAECFAAFSVVSLIGNIVSAALIDRMGRKPILMFSTIITSISMFIGTVYFTEVHKRVDRKYYWIPYSVEIIFSFAFTAGLGVIPATFQGELLPMRIKRQASAIVVMLASLASFLVNFSHEAVTRSFGVAGNYGIAAISSFLFFVWAHYNVFETKGKTLLEIQNYLSGKR